MAWTNPVRYPNSLEQNDPEGALNTYVIDNLSQLKADLASVGGMLGFGYYLTGTINAGNTGRANVSFPSVQTFNTWTEWTVNTASNYFQYTGTANSKILAFLETECWFTDQSSPVMFTDYLRVIPADFNGNTSFQGMSGENYVQVSKDSSPIKTAKIRTTSHFFLSDMIPFGTKVRPAVEIQNQTAKQIEYKMHFSMFKMG